MLLLLAASVLAIYAGWSGRPFFGANGFVSGFFGIGGGA
jgi:hypothetical protein